VRPALLLLALLALLTVPSTALAAPALQVSADVEAVRYGKAHDVTGTLLDGTTPVVGQALVLEGRRYPYAGSFREIARATTDAKGEFAFKPVLDRNHRLRVVAPALGLTSQIVTAYVVPSFELSYRAVRAGVVRLYLRYTVPRPVRLTAPTLFYLGRHGAKTASKRVSGDTKRVRAGRYSAHATVTLPAAWKGDFRFGICFRSSPGSGMGDPAATCPKLHYRF